MNKENLLGFHNSGYEAVLEASSRYVEDQRYLSTDFSKMKDLLIEASFYAAKENKRSIRKEDVYKAIDASLYRVNLSEEHTHEMIGSGEILSNISGKVVGQVNALTVYDYGDYSFGRHSRVSCTVAVSGDGVLNIERSVRLSGQIHSKSRSYTQWLFAWDFSFETELRLIC